MTLGELCKLVAENLTLEEVTPPANERIARTLNICAVRLGSELARINPQLFAAQQDYSVTAATTYLTLPTASVRIIGLDRVDGTQETPVLIIDSRQRQAGPVTRGQAMSDPVLYPQAGKLWFVGTPPSCTLRLRYQARITELAPTALSSEYSELPAEWQSVLAEMATAMLLPAKSAGFGKYAASYSAAIGAARAALTRTVETAPINCFDNSGYFADQAG